MKKYATPLVEILEKLNGKYCADSSTGFEHVDANDDIIEDDQD